MTSRIDIPGGWADIKDPDELSNRDRRLLRRHTFGAKSVREKALAAGIKPEMIQAEDSDPAVMAMAEKFAESLDADDMDAVDAAQAAFIVAYTAAWSLDRPLPTMDTVDDLPGPVFDALAGATAKLGDGSIDTTVDGALDPSSPTGPSAA